MKDFTHFSIRRRTLPEYNYDALWYNLKTIRFGEGVAQELPANDSEFYDIGINTKCNAECNFCLVPGTLIMTSKGEIPIEKITKNDLVFSYNEESGNIELKKVDQTFTRSYDGELIEIITENKIIRVTPNHKIYTQNRGWVEAEKLEVKDIILEF